MEILKAGQNEFVKFSVPINGLEVDAVFSRESIDGIFLPFLRKLTRMRREKKGRVVAVLAAPPGAGKSTLLSFLAELASEDAQSDEVQIIGMDGFHRRQAYLTSCTVIRDGEEIPMSRIKGAPQTFDLEKLTERLQRLAAGEKCQDLPGAFGRRGPGPGNDWRWGVQGCGWCVRIDPKIAERPLRAKV